MDVFELRRRLVNDYTEYVQSFLRSPTNESEGDCPLLAEPRAHGRAHGVHASDQRSTIDSSFTVHAVGRAAEHRVTGACA